MLWIWDPPNPYIAPTWFVIELALAGPTTKEIAHRIHPTEEAVDKDIRAFTRVLLLRYYGLQLAAIIRVTGHIRSLLEKNLALKQKHFSTAEALAEYLNQQGVSEKELYLEA